MDIDVDVIEEDRPKIFDYIIDRFSQSKTAFVPTYGTLQDRACIEEICRGLRHRWEAEHADDPAVIEFEARCKEDKKKYKRISEATKAIDPNPYRMSLADQVKKEYALSPEVCRRKYGEVFYYFDGLLGIKVSQSVHPAGIVISPVTLPDNYGVFHKDGGVVLQIDMEEIHEVSLVKYDMLVLKTIQVIRDACRYAGIEYPKSHEIDWDDQDVWSDMLRSNTSIFQMESSFSGQLMNKFVPKSIEDMCLLTACIRPSGSSYRDDLIARVQHKNPSAILDELLKDNYGYLVFQCDTIKFLQQICGLSGSEADNIRRAIGRKDRDRLEAALPQILDGYCNKSDKPRAEAEQEAKEFIQILEDSASYQFSYNHSVSYCMVGYLCAYLRYYHPIEFITSYLNNAANDDDIKNGTALAKEYGIRITQPKFGSSTSSYGFDRESNVISKGVSSVKYLNKIVPQELYQVYQHYRPRTFMETLRLIKSETSCDDRQLTNLIKIGYFSDYGNCRELEKLYEVFKFFKYGEAKSVSKKKEMSVPMMEILQRHATDKNVKGEELKSYTITDMDGLLDDCEQYVKSLQIPDADFKSKIHAQMELMGYVDITTGDEADRRKLLVLDTFDLKGPRGVWGVAVTTRSIGTGKEARLTVRKELYDRHPIKKLDVIYGAALSKNKAGYWYLNDYRLLG